MNKELKNIYKTNEVCPRCGKLLYTTDVYGYAFTCKNCDENFYTCEIKQTNDTFEISIPMTVFQYEKHKDKLKEISCCGFMGFDDIHNVMDIGWKYIPDNDIFYKIAAQLNNLSEEVFKIQEIYLYH